MVSTWKKSIARIVLAWASRNACQVCPDRVGAGSMSASLRIRGETISRSWRSWLPGSIRASAASTARSAHDSRGVLTCRWRTATWCRTIGLSASLARPERASRASQPNRRSTVR